MSPDREDWPRLASYVISARVAAGYKDRRAFAAVTGVTERTLGNLERGERVSPDTLAAVETAVGWKPDSARIVLHGGDPVLVNGKPGPWPSFTEEETRIATLFIESWRRANAEREQAAEKKGA